MSSIMSSSVKRASRAFVRPCVPTPSGTLPLSPIDKHPYVRRTTESLLVYKHGPDQASEVIKDALSKALVYYYPLAGRVVESSSPPELEVACTGQGVWFVEAYSDCTLQDLNYLEMPFAVTIDYEGLLLPHPRPNIDPDDAIVMMQVTQFKCGGFTVTTLFNHAVMDGMGMGQFMGAVGEISRGLERPTVDPIWSRDAIPVPAKQQQPQPPTVAPTTIWHLKNATIDLQLDSIKQLKAQYTKETGRKCSMFDIVAAKLWQCRTRAINLDPHDIVSLSFVVSLRPLLQHVLPSQGRGYYGNCVFRANAVPRSMEICDKSISWIVELIQEAKTKVPSEFAMLMRGELEQTQDQMASVYHTLPLSDATQIGINDVDFGWGFPIYSGPFTFPADLLGCMLLRPPQPKQGIRLLVNCVTEEHFPSFLDGMMDVDNLAGLDFEI